MDGSEHSIQLVVRLLCVCVRESDCLPCSDKPMENQPRTTVPPACSGALLSTGPSPYIFELADRFPKRQPAFEHV